MKSLEALQLTVNSGYLPLIMYLGMVNPFDVIEFGFDFLRDSRIHAQHPKAHPDQVLHLRF